MFDMDKFHTQNYTKLNVLCVRILYNCEVCIFKLEASLTMKQYSKIIGNKSLIPIQAILTFFFFRSPLFHLVSDLN